MYLSDEGPFVVAMDVKVTQFLHYFVLIGGLSSHHYWNASISALHRSLHLMSDRTYEE